MEKVCLNAVTCILCPLYGRTCDGKPEQPLDVQDIPTTEEETCFTNCALSETVARSSIHS